ncbi:retrovirus-related pol polyprotein from transposon TNT 1-94, partial [Tanacetum coccineum]
NDIEWFRIVEELQAKKAEALKSSKTESSNANRSKTPTERKPIWYLDSGCSRHMTGVKSYLHKYMEQPGPKVCDEKRGTIFNSNKEVVMIAPRVRETCSSKLQINKLAKQNLVIGLPSLVYSKDKPCSSCEKGKHHRASFKTKQTSSIKKCLHLLHMDLFGPVTPRSINHVKYTLIIVDEYSRCPVYIHNHKDNLGKFNEKVDDGYLLRYSLVSKAFGVFNIRRQQTEETYHITFDESPNAIKFSKPSVDNINIA